MDTINLISNAFIHRHQKYLTITDPDPQEFTELTIQHAMTTRYRNYHTPYRSLAYKSEHTPESYILNHREGKIPDQKLQEDSFKRL